MTRTVLVALALVAACSPRTPTPEGPAELARIEVNGVELHYVSHGQGKPVVLVHGGGDDLRYWDPQVGPLSQRHRVITYSRRHVWPNRNTVVSPDHSALVEATDLEALITALGLERVHLIGHSYGAFTALVLTLRRPDLVETLVLSEPPVLRWASHVPGGAKIFDQFKTTTWKPAADAFRQKNPEQGMRILLDNLVVPGFFDNIPPEARTQIMGNARDMEALAVSRDPFPSIPLQDVRRLRTPTLLLTGSKTTPINTIGHRVLARELPVREALVIEGASHEVFAEKPAETNAAVLAFLASH